MFLLEYVFTDHAVEFYDELLCNCRSCLYHLINKIQLNCFGRKNNPDLLFLI